MRFHVSYAILGRESRRELVVELASVEASSRSIARAILQHEFAEVDAPFGPDEILTAEQALAKFSIVDVTFKMLDGNIK
jgi:hypothetical protein